jgi:hypothetical protein
LQGVVLGVRADEASLDIIDGQVFNVKTKVVSGDSFLNLFVIHFDGLDFSGHCHGTKGDDHAGLDGASLYTTNWDSADTANLVYILER